MISDGGPGLEVRWWRGISPYFEVGFVALSVIGFEFGFLSG